MGQQKNTDMSMDDTEIKLVESPEEEEVKAQKKVSPTPKKKSRSAKYQAVRAQVDKTRHYDAATAIDLIKKLSYSSFPGTITAHVVLNEKQQGAQVEIEFPHSTGKSVKVEIADETTIAKLEKNEIDFDVLLSTPEMMPKLTKFAKILGPKGLMPNPKQGTLIAKTAERKKELEAGKLTIRTERKAPLLHVVIGNTKMETKELQANLQTLMAAWKNKIEKLSLAASMSPSVKVELAAKE